MSHPLQDVEIYTLLREVKKRGYNPIKICKVYTTGQIAKMCKVAPRTVTKWCDSGRLKCYRIPLSEDRRIQEEHLIEFLKAHNMPIQFLGVVSTEELQDSLPAIQSTYGEIE